MKYKAIEKMKPRFRKRLERYVRQSLCYINPIAHRVRQKLRKSHPFVEQQSSQPLICIRITKYEIEGRQGRRFNQLFRIWERSGCRVVVEDRLPFVGNFPKKRYKHSLLSENLSFVSSHKKITTPYIMVADTPAEELPAHCTKWITLEYGAPFDRHKHVALPFGMEPFLYQLQADRHCESWQPPAKCMRVFFAGGTREASYNKKLIETIYHKITRYQALEFIKAQFDPALLHIGKPPTDESACLAKLVLTDVSQAENRIPQSDWLKTLASAHFFLCLPGTDYPMCHHTIEAMACGTIPILQYPEHFEPPLVSGENCLSFSNQEELLTTLRRAIEMPLAEVEMLRNNACNYYQQHLSFPRFGQRLLEHPGTHLTLHIAKHLHPIAP